ncbi:hypothetical protein ACHAXS_001447 [Conticribra weissflogii]
MPRLALESTLDPSSSSQHPSPSNPLPDSSTCPVEITPNHIPKADAGQNDAPMSSESKISPMTILTPDQVNQPDMEDQGDELQKEMNILYKEAMLCLPSHVQHRPCRDSAPIWGFYRELEMPVGPETSMFSNVLCLVCLRDATRKKTSWQQALCRITSVDNASTHLVSQHIDDECVIQHFERENDPDAGDAITPLKNNTKLNGKHIKSKQQSSNEIIDIEKSYMTFQTINEASIRSVLSSNRFGYTDLGLPFCVVIHPCNDKFKAYQFIYALRVPILRPSHDDNNNTANCNRNNRNPLNSSTNNDGDFTITLTTPRKEKRKRSSKFYTHICLLCLKDIRRDQNINRDSWQRALCAHKRNRSALAHLRSFHWRQESVMQILSKESNAQKTALTASEVKEMKPIPLTTTNAAFSTITPGAATAGEETTAASSCRGAVVRSPMIQLETESPASKLNRTTVTKKRKQEQDSSGMTCEQWISYFQPIAEKLATHPQQRMFRMMLDGVRNAVLYGEEEPEMINF